MTSDIPAFPESTPATFEAVALALAAAFDDADREAATRLLADQILPWDLRALPSDAQPHLLAKVGYEMLAAQLAEVPRPDRLARLRDIACSRRGDRLVGSAIALAVARWVADHGRPRSHEVDGYLEDASPYLGKDRAELAGEAGRLDAALAAWERDAAAHPTCLAQQRVPMIHARHALASVRDGRFDVAMGALYVFLRNAGERPRQLDPH